MLYVHKRRVEQLEIGARCGHTGPEILLLKRSHCFKIFQGANIALPIQT